MQQVEESILLDKLKAARQASGLSGDEVAKKIGKSDNSVISRIENGKQKLTIDIINKLCTIYQLNPAALFINSTLKISEASSFIRKGFIEDLFFRSENNKLTESSVKLIKEKLPVLRKIGKTMKKLGEFPLELSDFFPLTSEITSYQAAKELGKEAAIALRQYLNLGNDPIADIQQLTWHIIKVPICSLDLGNKCCGIYNKDSFGTPLIIYSSANSLLTQRNIFTIAHELGHHFFSPEEPSVDTDLQFDDCLKEVLANFFAQEFLVPIDALSKFMQNEGLFLIKLQQKHVVLLCEYFKVSYKMMLVVLRSNNLINYMQFDHLNNIRNLKVYGYKPEKYITEPVELEPILKSFVVKGVRTNKLSLLFAAEMLGMTEGEVKKII